MNKVTSMKDYLAKQHGSDIHLYTLQEFTDLFNGEAFDDIWFPITIHPFTDPDDNYIEGWWVSFLNPVDQGNQFCVVAQDDHNGLNDFILYNEPIEEVFAMLNNLKPCERMISVRHENKYVEK